MAKKGHGRHGGRRVVAVTNSGELIPRTHKHTYAVYNQGQGPTPRKVMRLTTKDQKGYEPGSLVVTCCNAIVYAAWGGEQKLQLVALKSDPQYYPDYIPKGTVMMVVKQEFSHAESNLDDGNGEIYNLEKQFMLVMHGDTMYTVPDAWSIFVPYVAPVPQESLVLSSEADDEEDESAELSNECSSIVVDPA